MLYYLLLVTKYPCIEVIICDFKFADIQFQMATNQSYAQHYIECDSCEKNPGKFLCRTCPGHLCDACKSEHEKQKITQSHDVVELTSEKGNTLELLHCSEHRNEKMKGYCPGCKTPVCTQCMMETHNGHKVQNLAKVYSKIRQELQEEKKEIEGTLLPKYEELLAEEIQKERGISEMTDDLERQIKNHTEMLIERIRAMRDKRVQNLRREEKRVLDSVANSKTEIRQRIKILKEFKFRRKARNYTFQSYK
jgi:hypothetical protein